jgi:hypothetical protein
VPSDFSKEEEQGSEMRGLEMERELSIRRRLAVIIWIGTHHTWNLSMVCGLSPLPRAEHCIDDD